VPNAFVADPPLDQVVTRSVELGVRGAHGGSAGRPAAEWSVAAFGARNWDDIIFVAGSQIGTGYFRNAGQTQRVGLELAASARLGIVQLHAGYTLLRATFESALELPAAPNPGLEDGDAEPDEEEEGAEVPVERGDRMPGIPTHSVKAGIAVRPLAPLELGLRFVATSDRPYRGDEANLIDGVDGYALVHAYASLWLLDELQLFVRADNVLNARYETFGLLADPSEVLAGTSDPRFVSPGAPLGVWAGLVLVGP